MKYKEVITHNNPSQSHWEMNQLLLILEKISPKRILEIGTHMGGSTRVWRDVFSPELLIGVNNTDEMVDKTGIDFIQGDSTEDVVIHEIGKKLDGKPLDFVFLDGSHYYDDVLSDFETYSKMVRPGGIIGFHDVILEGNETCDVYRLWKEIRENHKTITIWDGTPAGTGTGVMFV